MQKTLAPCYCKEVTHPCAIGTETLLGINLQEPPKQSMALRKEIGIEISSICAML